MKTFTTTLYFLFSFTILFAQTEESEPTVNWEINFITGVPVSNFGDAMQDVGFGFDVLLMARLPKQPLVIGFQYSHLIYGREKINVYENIAGFDKRYELKTNTGSNILHSIARFQPNLKSFIRPYADVYLGAHHLFTTTRLIDPEVEEDSTVGRTKESSDWKFSYGAAVGASISLVDNFGVALNLKCAWTQSTSADFYVKKDDFAVVDNPIEAFEFKRSPINLVIPTIGITIQIRDCDNEEEEIGRQ